MAEERLPGWADCSAWTSRPGASSGLSAAFELNLTAMSLLALLVSAFLSVFNALSLSIVQRPDLLGRLHCTRRH